MDYTTLGRAGLKVSRLCLGTMNFGRSYTSLEDSHAIMDKALDVGMNFFDTANVYGRREYEGWTEQIIGRWFAQGGRRREQIVLATKVYNAMGDGPNDQGLSAYHIKRACEESLRRLKTDCIDLYQMHRMDCTTSWDEIWQAMEQLVSEGKVLYVGSSNFAGWHIATANQVAARRRGLGLVSEQSKYSLDTRTVELEVLPACREYGLGVIPYSPLGGGLLGGVLKKVAGGRRETKGMQEKVAGLRPQLEQYEALCKDWGEEPANVALGWLLANPAVTAPIVGPRNTDQLTGALRALEVNLDKDMLEKLDAIWPGPARWHTMFALLWDLPAPAAGS